jgi:hypothetical protein
MASTPLLLLLILALALGVVLVLLGLRGRRIDDHPLCRACRFDLIGVQGCGPCPECGSSLSSRRAVRRGNRRRRPRIAAVGAVFLIGGVVLGGAVAWKQFAGVDWNTWKPAWWLAGEVESTDPRIADPAVREFARRIAENQISESRRSVIVERAMARFVDPDVPWSRPWGDLLDQAWQSGHFTPEQLTTYARGLPVLSLAARPRIAQDLTWSPALEVRSPRAGTQGSMGVRIDLLSADFGGQTVEEPGGGRMYSGLSSIGSSSASVRVRIGAEHPPGRYDFKGRWRVHVLEGFSASDSIVAWEHEDTITVEVLPAGAIIVDLLPAPELTEEFTRSVRTRDVSIVPASAPRPSGGMIYLDSPPAPCAFRMYCRARDPQSQSGWHEWHVGTITARPQTRSSGTSFNVQLPEGLHADAVDIILRSCPQAAARTVDLTAIWDGEVIISDVPVKVSAENEDASSR